MRKSTYVSVEMIGNMAILCRKCRETVSMRPHINVLQINLEKPCKKLAPNENRVELGIIMQTIRLVSS